MIRAIHNIFKGNKTSKFRFLLFGLIFIGLNACNQSSQSNFEDFDDLPKEFRTDVVALRTSWRRTVSRKKPANIYESCEALCLHALSSGQVKKFLIHHGKSSHQNLKPNTKMLSFQLVQRESCPVRRYPRSSLRFWKTQPDIIYPTNLSRVNQAMHNLAAKGICLEHSYSALGEADVVITNKSIRKPEQRKRNYVSIHIKTTENIFEKKYMMPECVRISSKSLHCASKVLLGKKVAATAQTQKRDSITIIRKVLTEYRPAKPTEIAVIANYFWPDIPSNAKRFLPPFNTQDQMLYLQILENPHLPYFSTPRLMKVDNIPSPILDRYVTTLFKHRRSKSTVKRAEHEYYRGHKYPSISVFNHLPDHALDNRFLDVENMVREHVDTDFAPMLARYGNRSTSVLFDIMEDAANANFSSTGHKAWTNKKIIKASKNAFCRLGSQASTSKDRLKRFEETYPTKSHERFDLAPFLSIGVDKDWLWQRWQKGLQGESRIAFEKAIEKAKKPRCYYSGYPDKH